MADQNWHSPYLTTGGRFGLERENLRVQADGSLALTPHPAAFGDKLTNPEITTDFSESQVEIVTPTAASIPEALSHLHCLSEKVCHGIGPELLWPFSIPPDPLPPEDQIPIADFGPDGKDKSDYRVYLSKKYGRYKQLYCGLHFNFSFCEKTAGWRDREALNDFYLHLTAQAMRYRFFLVHLLAASPATDDDDVYRSLRLSIHGYRNPEPIYLDYTDTARYLASLSSSIDNERIEGPRELYQQVRIKGDGFENLLLAPKASRVELRIPDLNPLYTCGINPDDLYLMHLYLIWAAHTDDGPFDRAAQKRADGLADQAALMKVSDALAEQMEQVFDRLNQFLSAAALPERYGQALHQARARWLHPELRYAEKINALLHQTTFMDEGLRLANQMKHFYLNTAHCPCL